MDMDHFTDNATVKPKDHLCNKTTSIIIKATIFDHSMHNFILGTCYQGHRYKCIGPKGAWSY